MVPDSTAPIRGAIVAMTRDNVIGLDGNIPWHYPEDLKRFKRRTLNSTIIMGRLTWESIGSKPLPSRRNIVISRNPVSSVEHYNDIDLAINASEGEDIWIIGGGQIYTAVFSWLTLLDITYVPDIIDSPDAVKFPEIDLNQWQEKETTLLKGTELSNIIYRRI